MARAIARRLIWLIPILLGLSLLTFSLVAFLPGDVAQVLAGTGGTEQDIQALRTSLGLDQPLPVQYLRYLSRLVRGDLGRSPVTGRPVATEIRENLPPTLQLAAFAMLFSILVGVPFGVFSALKQNTLWDTAAAVLSVIGVSMPTFWMGILLILVFSVQLGLLPVTGSDTPRHLILPGITLGLSSIALLERMTRSSMLEVLNQDYIRTARAKGLRERAVIGLHALKNAMIPTVTAIGLQFGRLAGGTVITESVFARPGLGRLLIDSISLRDVVVVQGTIMFLAGGLVLINLVVDILYVYLDPRIKYQ
jgi:peptide/nickel transport system permease protein